MRNWYWNGAFAPAKMKHTENISREGSTKRVEIRPDRSLVLCYNCDPPIRMDPDVHTYVTYLNNDLRFRCRNPNVIDHHGRNDTLLPASREKSRFRSLTWDQYDPVHQKYLEIGKSSRQMHRSKFLFTPFSYPSLFLSPVLINRG